MASPVGPFFASSVLSSIATLYGQLVSMIATSTR
jgi:hypothetical protein